MEKPSVILVDDSHSFLTIAERALRDLAGGDVLPFECGARALDHLALCGSKYPMPGLVLLDRVMPGIDGFEFLAQARAQAHLEELSIIIVSGSDDEEHVVQSQVLGADAYLVKPVQTTDYPLFVEQVKSWLVHKRETKNLRRICGGSDALELSVQKALSLSGAAMPPTAVSRNPPGSIQNVMHQAIAYIFGSAAPSVAGLFTDRKAMELSRACREEGVDEVDMYRTTKDQVLVVKRQRVFWRLMDCEWANPEFVRRFGVSVSTMEKVRVLWNRKQKESATLLQMAERKKLE